MHKYITEFKMEIRVFEFCGIPRLKEECAHKPPRCLAQPWTEDALHG